MHEVTYATVNVAIAGALVWRLENVALHVEALRLGVLPKGWRAGVGDEAAFTYVLPCGVELTADPDWGVACSAPAGWDEALSTGQADVGWKLLVAREELDRATGR